jgi:hypothetical protein
LDEDEEGSACADPAASAAASRSETFTRAGIGMMAYIPAAGARLASLSGAVALLIGTQGCELFIRNACPAV